MKNIELICAFLIDGRMRFSISLNFFGKWQEEEALVEEEEEVLVDEGESGEEGALEGEPSGEGALG